MDLYKIGKVLYLVHKSGIDFNMKGSRVIPVKVTGYQNIDGTVLPILKAGSVEYDPTKNNIFVELETAVENIQSKK